MYCLTYDALGEALRCRREIRQRLRGGRPLPSDVDNYSYWTARAREELGWGWRGGLSRRGRENGTHHHGQAAGEGHQDGAG